jgi:hypothetical protein
MPLAWKQFKRGLPNQTQTAFINPESQSGSTKRLAGRWCLAVTASAISLVGAARRQMAGRKLTMTEVVVEKAVAG